VSQGLQRVERPAESTRAPRGAGSTRHGLAPDQGVILRWQRLAGNAAVQDLLAQRAAAPQNAPAAGRARPDIDVMRKGLPLAVQIKIDAKTTLDPDSRVMLIGAYKILSRMGYAWGLISRVRWVGSSSMLVETNGEEFRRFLDSQGVRSRWWEFSRRRSKGDLWGARKTVDGVGLHVRGKAADEVEIHFDLSPPAWWWWPLSGLWHWIWDDWQRGKSVTPQRLRKALRLEQRI
jgi:hypothetical protein